LHFVVIIIIYKPLFIISFAAKTYWSFIIQRRGKHIFQIRRYIYSILCLSYKDGL